MRRRFAALLLCLASLAWGCSKKTEPEPTQAGPMAGPPARFYYDLGPAAVDVSAYPSSYQQGYKLFSAVCATCHSTARALNAPYAEADTWKRYVRRMHVKMESRSALPAPQEEALILEFLIYDSKVRKLDKSEEFQAQQEKLKTRFEEAAKR